VGVDRSTGFGVAVEFKDGSVALAVSGELDSHTTPFLQAVFDGALGGDRSVADVDLARCTFMSAAGLRTLVELSRRLRILGGGCTIYSPSTMVCKMVEVTGLAGELVFDLTPVVARIERDYHDGRSRSLAASAVGATVATRLSAVSSIPANREVIDGALHLVVALVHATIGGADGVSVSLWREGQLRTVAASDQTILSMDADQYATGEGPCVDASIKGEVFHADSLAEESRWPAFVPRARELGIGAILSTPLLQDETAIGALNIYSHLPAVFRERERELVGVIARETSGILEGAAAAMSLEEQAMALQRALRTREEIAMAQGVLMERNGVAKEEAYAILRRASAATNMPLRDQAGKILLTTTHGAPGPGEASEHLR